MQRIILLLCVFIFCWLGQSCTTPAPESTKAPATTPTPTTVPTTTPTYGAYRMPITLTENSGTALTNYQICVDVSTDNITYAHVLGTNGEDLRFRINGTECDYWIQTWDNAGKSRIWVEIPSLTASGSDILYMYYGTSGASALSNADNTMLLYDAFDDTTTDLAKWQDGSVYPAHVNETGGNMVLYNNYPTNGYRGYLISQAQFEKNISVDASMKLGDSSANVYYICILQFDGLHPAAGDIPQNGFYLEWGSWNATAGDSNLNIQRSINSTVSTIQNTTATKDLVYHTMSIQYYNTQIKSYVDNVLKHSVTDTTDFTTGYIGFSTREQKNPAAQVYMDWVLVRKIAMPEPTVALGTEESMY